MRDGRITIKGGRDKTSAKQVAAASPALAEVGRLKAEFKRPRREAHPQGHVEAWV
jgi:hypothetical protein